MNPLLSGWLWVLLYAAGVFVSLLPRAWEVRLGELFGSMLLALDCKRYKIALENMRRCLPALSADERESLLAENYRHYGCLTLELLHFFSPFPGHYRSYARRIAVLEGMEHWQHARARGRGAIFISAHMANWEMMTAIGAMDGIPITMVTRHLKPEWLHKRIEAQRLSTGCKAAYAPRTLPAIMRALRNGECVGFALDQYAPAPMGLPVPFFGVKVETLAAVGPLAHRTGAHILPVTQKRESDGLIRVTISPALDLGGDLADQERATAALARRIEGMIRDNPGQWLWVHRRFKNLPPG